MLSCDNAAVEWLKTYLTKLSNEGDLDVDVLADYLAGILGEGDQSDEDLIQEIESFLSAFISNELCKKSSAEIVHHFTQHRTPTTLAATIPQCGPPGLVSMEEQMRTLLQENYEQQLKSAATQASDVPRVRDACTTAVLREAGVAGYQGDSEEEKDVEIAITNAQFQAKQQLEAGAEKWSCPVNGTPNVPGDDDADDGAASDLDLEELENISGYGKKNDVQPGTVEDALSILNPSLFGESRSIAAKPFPTGVTRLPTPGPRPMGFQLPAATVVPTVVEPNRSDSNPKVTVKSATCRAEKKKKPPAPSKHIAKVGAQAEAKKSGIASKNEVTARGIARARHDEMDAFLFSASESDPDDAAPLPESGKNRESVLAAEQAARKAAALSHSQRRDAEKAGRAQQLEQIAQRKQTAQKKAQKVERRR